MNLDSHPLHPVFLLVAKEYDRSINLHQPWETAGHSVRAMLAVAKAELAEVELAIELGSEEETITEFIHEANVSCKAVRELLRRKTI